MEQWLQFRHGNLSRFDQPVPHGFRVDVACSDMDVRNRKKEFC
jgi:hypothetical protein